MPGAILSASCGAGLGHVQIQGAQTSSELDDCCVVTDSSETWEDLPWPEGRSAGGLDCTAWETPPNVYLAFPSVLSCVSQKWPL